jgi:glycosyltransferase involved in cell wall biosynthesis
MSPEPESIAPPERPLTAAERETPAPLLSVIVPAYNEARTLPAVLTTLLGLDLDLEVIVVDDASSDATPQVLAQFAGDSRLSVVRHAVNGGKGRGIRSGLARARGAWIAIQDADVELDPCEIPRSVSFGEANGLDVVLGSRFLGADLRGGTRLSIAANWFLTMLVRVLFQSRISDMETGHKVFRRRVVEGMQLRAERYDFEPEFVCRVLARRVRLGERAIAYRPRSVAEGKGIGWRDGVQAVLTILRWRWRTLGAGDM